ncbi:metallophosphoesterase family protein [Dongia sedimenti]|uniref:Metallophosphoesterase n=1 Tax=Dongia sedimenti TaxID=3064282 RepID=A0ABU0YUR2_9PROT|nr:metallophosphoesterase [Rhodospirillaceae bacterium R-7]
MKRFLLLSDIHACSDDPSSSKAASYVSSISAAASGRNDPFTALEQLARDEQIRADYVLCAGDMTNKSTPAAFSYVWDRLSKLAASLSAPLIATVGNHDIDSRYKENNHDPRGYAMALSPTIPVGERQHFLEYWAENFTLISRADCNILVLNTAAYHGGGKEVKRELEHGRVSEATLSKLKTAIAGSPLAPVNILLCHHHPIKGEPSDEELIGMTRGGDKLIDLLNEDSRHWIVVHGHKHRPELFYGFGAGNAPTILACASFSAQVNADAHNKNPNQVHLLECDAEAAKKNGLDLAGHVQSWTWQPGIGWIRALANQGLDHRVGFGYRGSSIALVNQLVAYIGSRGVKTIAWDEVLQAIPVIGWQVPAGFKAFKRDLAAAGLKLLETDGTIAEVGYRR